MNFSLLIKGENTIFLALNFSDVVFILLINVKMPTIVGILTFINRINFMLSSVENEKVSRPGTIINIQSSLLSI